MITVTATKLRNNLFGYLEKVKQGETVTIILNKQETARLVPATQTDWRDGLTNNVKTAVSPEEIIKPLDDVWEEYI